MPDVPIKNIVVTTRCRKDFGGLDALAASMKEIGQLQEIVLDPSKHLVCGERRLRAAEQLGWKSIRAYVATDFADACKAALAEQHENTCRKDLTPSEAVAQGKKIEAMVKPMADAAKAEGRQRGGGDRKSQEAENRSRKNYPKAIQDESKRTTAQAGEAVGMSRVTYEKAKAIVESGDAKLIEEMDRTGKVSPVHAKLETPKRVTAKTPVIDRALACKALIASGVPAKEAIPRCHLSGRMEYQRAAFVATRENDELNEAINDGLVTLGEGQKLIQQKATDADISEAIRKKRGRTERTKHNRKKTAQGQLEVLLAMFNSIFEAASGMHDNIDIPRAIRGGEEKSVRELRRLVNLTKPIIDEVTSRILREV